MPVRRKKRKGFTLVEVIVVLVILAILAGLLIPALTGWIDRAQQKTAMVEARSCLSALQTLSVERYAAGKAYSLTDDKAATLKLAEVPAKADLLSAAVERGKVTQMGYRASNGVRVSYINGVYSFASLGNAEDMKVITDALSTAKHNMDSGAQNISNSYAKDFIEELKKQGIDLAAMGATTWAYKNDSKELLWTTQNLNNKNVGDSIYVMRYNLKTGTYTVWEATVNEGSTSQGDDHSSYKIIGKITGKVVGPPNGKQTYDNMVDVFNQKTGGN